MGLLTTNSEHSIPTLTLASCSCCCPDTRTCVVCWTMDQTTKQQHPFPLFPLKKSVWRVLGVDLELTQLKRIIFLPLLLFKSGWNLVLYNREGVGTAASLSCICLNIFIEARICEMLMELVAWLKCKLIQISLSSCNNKNTRNNPWSLEDPGSSLSISSFPKLFLQRIETVAVFWAQRVPTTEHQKSNSQTSVFLRFGLFKVSKVGSSAVPQWLF